MISGKLNSEKIWHENLTGLSTSPVRCSHFTLGNPKSRFLSLAAAALLSVELILIVFYVNKYITIKYCSSFAATIIIPLPYGLHWLSVRHRVNFNVKFKKHGIRVFAGALRPGEKCQQSVTEHFQAETKTHYSAPSRWARYCDEPSMSVCLYVYVHVFVCPRIMPGTTCSIFTDFCEYNSVVFWRRCDKLCTSGVVDDFKLAHNGLGDAKKT